MDALFDLDLIWLN